MRGGVFDEIFIYTEASLPLQFKEDFKDKLFIGKGNNYTPTWNGKGSRNSHGLMPTRGFGYWCWKPKVILMALEQIKDNDLLLFADIGCEFNYFQSEHLIQMFKEVNKNEFMGVLHNALNKNFQKGDTLKYFNLLNDEKFLNSKQAIGGLLFMKKTKKTISILNEWMNIFYNHFNLIDDTPSNINHKDFIRNLHDQSILNAIMYKHNCVNFPIEYYFDRYNKPILYRRNLIYLSNNVKDTEYFNSLFTIYPKSETQPGAKVKVQEFIDKYNSILYKLNLMSKYMQLNKSISYNTAKSRIHNQLSYKLGQAMIANSKSILGYIRMPYVLSYIKDMHKKEQVAYNEKIKANPSLKLPPLESYPDYKEALKEKECLTYKLGEALIQADKSPLKLGYLSLWFKCKGIQRGYKK